MASTYSTSLRLELMATGDQSGTWGDTTNTNLGTLLEQAITGVLSVAQGDAELTLTSTDGASDQARNAVVNLTGAMTGTQNVIVPTSEKLYLIKNSTTGGFAVTVKTSAGTGVAVAAGTAQWVYCDGTNVVQGLSGTMAVQAPGAVAITGGTIAGLTSLSSSGSTAGYVGFQTISTEAGAAAGPIIDLYRDSATPTTNDILGQLLFSGEDSAGNTQEYGSIQAVIADATSGSEDSTIDFYVQVAGVRTLIATLGPGLTGLVIATQAQQETASAVNVVVTPGRQQYHPSAAKAWAVVTWSGGTPTLAASYNVSGISDDGVGKVTVSWDADFSSANYGVAGLSQTTNSNDAAAGTWVTHAAKGAGGVQFILSTQANPPVFADPASAFFAAYGDL